MILSKFLPHNITTNHKMSLHNWRRRNSNCKRTQQKKYSVWQESPLPRHRMSFHSQKKSTSEKQLVTDWVSIVIRDYCPPSPIFPQTLPLRPPSLIFFAIGLIPPPKGWCREEKIRSFVPPCVFSAVQGAPKALNDNYLSPLQFAQLCHVHACAR